ncbi:unnamed protein product, partial [Scytosiphon promiscuus]
QRIPRVRKRRHRKTQTRSSGHTEQAQSASPNDRFLSRQDSEEEDDHNDAMVNPVGKAAVFAGAAAVGAHVAWGEYKRERERRAADAERDRERATHDSFVEEMRRKAEAAAQGRERAKARVGRSPEEARAVADLTDLRASLMGKALGKLRRALEKDFARSPPLSSVGLPLIGRADTVDFVIAAVLLAWGDEELLQELWPRRRRR